jgi:hypothetical protein
LVITPTKSEYLKLRFKLLISIFSLLNISAGIIGLIKFFNKIIDVLNTNNIPYMLSGSIAMGVYVVPRATRDFDFVVELKLEDIDQFIENFKTGYYCNIDSVKDAVTKHSIFNIIDHESGYKADFVVLKNEIYRQTEFNRKNKIEYLGKDIFIVSCEDLLLSKLLWIQTIQSNIQMEDIKLLAEVKDLDWTYIKYWISTLKISTFNLIKNV